MKPSRPFKKKKKEKTWAEAATLVLIRSKSKMMTSREILEKIFEDKIKDTKMTKQAENVLKTMLAQNSVTESCPFYKVGDKTEHTYSLKDPQAYVKVDGTDGSDADSLSEVNDDSNGSGNSLRRSKRKASPLVDVVPSQNESELKKSATEKELLSGMTRRSNSYTGSALRKAQMLSRRRKSSPNTMPALPNLNVRNKSHLHPVHRSRSTNYLQKMSQANANNKSRNSPLIDLETPSSVLTNTRLKSVITSATYSMLPASFQYQLVQLLPLVDRIVDDKGVPRMSQTALNNEFFSQALQDWVMQLSEGEFTRETQARIMQEIAKEISKISPWKEKFFEEYYGQKKELKRTRSRSHDATSNLADLSFEAQLLKFQHLRDSIAEEEARLEEEEANAAVASDSESEQDPDYARPPMRPVAKSVPLKSINRRKINTPFKRTILNSSGDYAQNTAMIHRKANMSHSMHFNQFGSSASAKFTPRAVTHPPNFQIRDEFFPSDSEGSETGDLSDSNSFHQHDETDEDEDGESSDGMMNIGDDNLLDVDDTDSDDFDRDCVNVDHSYTRPNNMKIRRSSDDRDWRRPMQGLVGVMPVMSNDDNKIPTSNQNTTLVLRPKGNLGQAVQAMHYNEDSSSTSPEQPFKRSFQEQVPMFEKILTVSKENTSKEERVGVLFGRCLQPMTANVYHGEAIIPRISTTSGLMSSPVTPTTVCTSTTSSRTFHETELKRTKPTCHARSEAATAPRSTNNNSNVSDHVLPPEIAVVPKAKPLAIDINHATLGFSSATIHKTSVSTHNKLPDLTKLKLPQNTCEIGGSALFKPLTIQGVTATSWQNKSAANEICEARSKSPVLQSPRRISMSSPTQTKVKAEGPKTSPILLTPQAKKPSLPTIPVSSPVKRTRTLAEIKAQMKAKRLAAAASASPSPGSSSSSKPQSPVTKPSVKLTQPVFCPSTAGTISTPIKRAIDFAPSVAETSLPEDIEAVTVTPEKAPNSDQSEKNLASENKKEIIEALPKNLGKKIILKIKTKEGNNYSVKVGNASTDKSSESEDEPIIRNTRRLSQVISSSGDSSDDLDREKKLNAIATRGTENYSMLSQLAIPGSYTGKVISIMDPHSLKRTQKSPVFGEPAFEGISLIPNSVPPILSVSVADDNLNTGAKCQPFVSDKPVIGFQDIPSCTALSSSNVPTFVQPSSNISATNDSQKYRSTSKGKSLVQMQQLARTNRIPSDESEMAESDTEDDSNVSTTSSAEDYGQDSSNSQSLIGKSNLRKRPNTGRVTGQSNKYNKLENQSHDHKNNQEEEDEGSDCEDSYSSSSNDEKSVITNCICACKRLVLCKGCGAYTHEECLSSSKLCSLCV